MVLVMEATSKFRKVVVFDRKLEFDIRFHILSSVMQKTL